MAVIASSTGMSKPGNPDPLPDRKLRCLRPSANDFSNNLVTRYQGQLLCGQIAIDDMKIGPENSTGTHANKHLSTSGRGHGKFLELKRVSRPGEHHRTHLIWNPHQNPLLLSSQQPPKRIKYT